jgi:hypothetical protein
MEDTRVPDPGATHMRAIDYDDPVYGREKMEAPRGPRPTEQEVDALLEVLRKKHAYQKVDLYGEPEYGRSIEVELFIVEDWRSICANRLPTDQH